MSRNFWSFKNPHSFLFVVENLQHCSFCAAEHVTAYYYIILLICSSYLFYSNIQSQEKVHAVTVSREEIIKAMQIQLQKGYDITSTTNGGRFYGSVLLQLSRWARERNPEGPPLLIAHEDIFEAYLRVTGLAPEKAPVYVNLPYQHKQDQLIEYRTSRVIKKIMKGRQPELALNVKAFWPNTPEIPRKFSYIDTASTPHLKVTNHRVVTYRLLDFGDMLLYDEVRGVTGRPKSGILALIFKVIGEARMVQSRIAISEDGLQIARAKARKGRISVTSTLTIYPDGYTEKDIPSDRPDLLAIETLLKQPIRIKYMPINFPENLCNSGEN